MPALRYEQDDKRHLTSPNDLPHRKGWFPYSYTQPHANNMDNHSRLVHREHTVRPSGDTLKGFPLAKDIPYSPPLQLPLAL